MAASFDCAKASSEIEKAICASAELSQLDEELAAAFQEALKKGDKPVLRNDQRAWLKRRDYGCRRLVPRCLRDLYHARITSLKGPAQSAEQPGIKEIARINSYRPSSIYGVERGRLIFSQYGKSGNAHDVLAVDLATHKEEVLLSEVHEAKYLDSNDSIVAAASDAQLTRPIGIYDRKTGRLLRQKKLERQVLAARIRGETLVAVRGFAWRLQNKREVDSSVLSAIRRYAELLTRTTTRVEERIAILESIAGAGAQEASLQAALLRAHYREFSLRGQQDHLAAAQKTWNPSLSSQLSGAWSANGSVPDGLARSLSTRSDGKLASGGTQIAVRQGDKNVYVGRRACDGAENPSGVLLEVFAAPFKRVARIPIAACDDADTYDIGNLEVAPGYVVLTPRRQDRKESSGALMVLHTRTLKITACAQADPSEGVYYFSASTALRCDCAVRSCKLFDLETWSATDTNPEVPFDVQCPAPADEECWKCQGPQDPRYLGFGELEAVGSRYAVFSQRDPQDTNVKRLEFRSVSEERSPLIPPGGRNGVFRGFVSGGEAAVLSAQVNDTVFFRVYDMRHDVTTTIVDFIAHNLAAPVATTYKDYVLIGCGRDLYVYDTARSRLAWCERNFIEGGFANNGNGLDKNEIRRMFVDRGRLVAATFGDEQTRVLDLERLLAALPPNGDVLGPVMAAIVRTAKK